MHQKSIPNPAAETRTFVITLVLILVNALVTVAMRYHHAVAPQHIGLRHARRSEELAVSRFSSEYLLSPFSPYPMGLLRSPVSLYPADRRYEIPFADHNRRQPPQHQLPFTITRTDPVRVPTGPANVWPRRGVRTACDVLSFRSGTRRYGSW